MEPSQEILICYVSSATQEFSKDDLLKLLEKSRARNSARGVTGVLLYRGGTFLQVLEGPSKVVPLIFEKISADPRHKGVLKLLHRPIHTRAFSDWSMGFRELQADDARRIEQASENDEQLPPFVEKLIETFRRINR